MENRMFFLKDAFCSEQSAYGVIVCKEQIVGDWMTIGHYRWKCSVQHNSDHIYREFVASSEEEMIDKAKDTYNGGTMWSLSTSEWDKLRIQGQLLNGYDVLEWKEFGRKSIVANFNVGKNKIKSVISSDRNGEHFINIYGSNGELLVQMNISLPYGSWKNLSEQYDKKLVTELVEYTERCGNGQKMRAI